MYYRGGQPSAEEWYDELFGDRTDDVTTFDCDVYDAVTSQSGPFFKSLKTTRDVTASLLTQSVSGAVDSENQTRALARETETYCALLSQMITTAGQEARHQTVRRDPVTAIRAGRAILLAGMHVFADEAQARVEAIDTHYSYWLPERYKDRTIPFLKRRVRNLRRYCAGVPEPSDILYESNKDGVGEKADVIARYGGDCATDFRDSVNEAIALCLERQELLSPEAVVGDAVATTIFDQLRVEKNMVDAATAALEKKKL